MRNQIRGYLFLWGVDTHVFEFSHMLQIYGSILVCTRCWENEIVYTYCPSLTHNIRTYYIYLVKRHGIYYVP